MKLKVFPESWEHKHGQIDRYFWISARRLGASPSCIGRLVVLDEYVSMDQDTTQAMHNTRL